jgi:two-component system CheB/CheR fusion protein
MTSRKVTSVGEYLATLESDGEERVALLSELLGSRSAFGEDAGCWRVVTAHLVGSRALRSALRTKFRVWSAGCATGEEAFTVAMILAEAFELDVVERYVEIVATDVDPYALAIASAATYDRASVARLPRPTVAKYFDENDRGFTIKEPLRRLVRFERHDLLHDAPPTDRHLVVCRDVAGTLSAAGRRRATRQLVRALPPSGLLVLGRGEWPEIEIEIETELETVDAVRGIYRRVADGGER